VGRFKDKPCYVVPLMSTPLLLVESSNSIGFLSSIHLCAFILGSHVRGGWGLTFPHNVSGENQFCGTFDISPLDFKFFMLRFSSLFKLIPYLCLATHPCLMKFKTFWHSMIRKHTSTRDERQHMTETLVGVKGRGTPSMDLCETLVWAFFLPSLSCSPSS
jgi:hypothetical protein